MNKWIMLQPSTFVVKRLLLALTCVYLRDHISLQVQVFSSITVFSVIYLVIVLPLDSNMMNGLEIMNEILSFIILYHLIIFTDWVPHPEIRYKFGYMLIAFTTLCISVHIILMASALVHELKRSIKKRKFKKKIVNKVRKEKKSKKP